MDLGAVTENRSSSMPVSAHFTSVLHEAVGKLNLQQTPSSGNGAASSAAGVRGPVGAVAVVGHGASSADTKAIVVVGSEAAPPPPSGGIVVGPAGSGKKVRYRECQKNHAAHIGSHAYDGCGDFMPLSEEEPLKCAVCECHRNFHRREVEGETTTCEQCRSRKRPSALMLTPPPPTSKDQAVATAEEMLSSGGGYGSTKKRFRTKFTAEQKANMAELAEKLGWRIQKQDEEEVQEFVHRWGIKKHVLKVWMHNNKHQMNKRLHQD